jgi:hypothetical protein
VENGVWLPLLFLRCNNLTTAESQGRGWSRPSRGRIIKPSHSARPEHRPGAMAAPKQAGGLALKLKSWVSSPTGPRTTHFWGPIANWGFVIAVSTHAAAGWPLAGRRPSRWRERVVPVHASWASCPTDPPRPATPPPQGLADSQKPPEAISRNMTGGKRPHPRPRPQSPARQPPLPARPPSLPAAGPSSTCPSLLTPPLPVGRAQPCACTARSSCALPG